MAVIGKGEESSGTKAAAIIGSETWGRRISTPRTTLGVTAPPRPDGSGVCQSERLRMFHDTELGCGEPQTGDRKWILSGGDRGRRGRHAATECNRVDQRNQRGKGAEHMESTRPPRTQRGSEDIHTARAIGSIPARQEFAYIAGFLAVASLVHQIRVKKLDGPGRRCTAASGPGPDLLRRPGHGPTASRKPAVHHYDLAEGLTHLGRVSSDDAGRTVEVLDALTHATLGRTSRWRSLLASKAHWVNSAASSAGAMSAGICPARARRVSAICVAMSG